MLQDAPHHLSNAARALYLFLAFILASPIGLLLALAPDAAYDYVEGGGLWGLGAHADQQLAGVTMAMEQAIVFFAVFAIFFFRFLADEENVEVPRFAKDRPVGLLQSTLSLPAFGVAMSVPQPPSSSKTWFRRPSSERRSSMDRSERIVLDEEGRYLAANRLACKPGHTREEPKRAEQLRSRSIPHASRRRWI